MNDNGTLQLPPQASTFAPEVDSLYYFIFWGCLITFVLILAAMGWFMVRYRRRKDDTYRPSPSHNTPLEITWSVIPLLLMMAVFVWGFDSYMNAHVAPGGAKEYYVTGKQWLWEIRSPEGNVAVNDMYVPVDTPIKLILSSTDVIHSYFVPAFRTKMDAYPNQYTTMWFEATRTGSFDVYCTEYCGDQHSAMLGKVHVLTAGEYEQHLKEVGGKQDDQTWEEFGQKMYTANACDTCHSVDGSVGSGPSFLGIWGKQEQMADGTTITVDENYIRESILQPQAKIVAGYEPVMPTYTGLLNEEQIQGLIEYIKSLGN